MVKPFILLNSLAKAVLFVFLIPIITIANNGFCVQYPSNDKTVQTPSDGGIKEIVPLEFQTRYAKWKEEFLSSNFGKDAWSKFENRKEFVLTIKLEDKDKKGAGTGDYQWNQAGELVGATIFLGGKIDKGFPDPIYYPVMNSISEFNSRREISGNIVAATKFAHEFGHINLTYDSNQEKIKLENKLMPVYNSIFLKNGYNTADKKLIDLANQMGGTPTQIWENREYWGEASAMHFLLEKTSDLPFQCSLIKKINENVATFAKDYEERFSGIYGLQTSKSCRK